MNLEPPKVGDRVVGIEIKKFSPKKIEVNVMLLEVTYVKENYRWIASILYRTTIRNSYKLDCLERYFKNRPFECYLSFRYNIFCYKILSREDEYFVVALCSISSRNRIWKKIYRLDPEKILNALKPYLLSSLGRQVRNDRQN
jgi:hypothetical protein